MHEPIKASLEDYLNGGRERIPKEFHAHLRACASCASELKLLEMQSKMLHALRSAQDLAPAEGLDMEPRPGFYGRVIERIEDQRRSSIWSVFLEPRFGRRLAVASAALILMLATYLVSTEPGGIVLAPQSAVALTSQSVSDIDIPDSAVQQDSPAQQQQRDAVLVDLASYHE